MIYDVLCTVVCFESCSIVGSGMWTSALCQMETEIWRNVIGGRRYPK